MNKCWYCGRAFVPGDAKRGPTWDYLQPLSRGGNMSAKNKVRACCSCASLKKDKTLEEFRHFMGRREFPLNRALHRLTCSLVELNRSGQPRVARSVASLIVKLDVKRKRLKFFGEVAA